MPSPNVGISIIFWWLVFWKVSFTIAIAAGVIAALLYMWHFDQAGDLDGFLAIAVGGAAAAVSIFFMIMWPIVALAFAYILIGMGLNYAWRRFFGRALIPSLE